MTDMQALVEEIRRLKEILSHASMIDTPFNLDGPLYIVQDWDGQSDVWRIRQGESSRSKDASWWTERGWSSTDKAFTFPDPSSAYEFVRKKAKEASQ